MANIQQPKWAPDSVPTTRGWVLKNELIKSQAIPQSFIDGWFGKASVVAPVVAEAAKPVVHMLNEAPAATLVNDDPVVTEGTLDHYASSDEDEYDEE